MTRILIADDHAVARAGLHQFLEDSPGVGTLGEAGSAAEVLRQLDAGSWDLLLLDINLPDRSGLDVLRLVRDAHPETRVLVLSGYPEKQYALNVLRAGAAGYLPKDTNEKLAELILSLRGQQLTVWDAFPDLFKKQAMTREELVKLGLLVDLSPLPSA